MYRIFRRLPPLGCSGRSYRFYSPIGACFGWISVQGREDDAAQQMVAEALALQGPGATMLLMELVPADIAAAVDAALTIPTVGIGAGADTTGQVLVWQDALGLNQQRVPSFVSSTLICARSYPDAAQTYRDDVLQGVFPDDEHSF